MHLIHMFVAFFVTVAMFASAFERNGLSKEEFSPDVERKHVAVVGAGFSGKKHRI